MDKASDFGSEDCRFESCHGHMFWFLIYLSTNIIKMNFRVYYHKISRYKCFYNWSNLRALIQSFILIYLIYDKMIKVGDIWISMRALLFQNILVVYILLHMQSCFIIYISIFLYRIMFLFCKQIGFSCYLRLIQFS